MELDMKRLAILLLLIPSLAQAGPLHWLKRQAVEHPLRTKFIFSGVSAAVYAEGLHQCRIVNVENCDAHYGAAWGSYTATVSLNVVAQIVGHKLGGKQGNAIAYGGSAAMLGWGAYQWHGGLNKPKEEK